MHISLRDFLLHGKLGTFTAGMTVAEMDAILGVPDAVSLPRRKIRWPQIYKYGDFEINASDNTPDVTCSIYVECPYDGTAIRFPKAATNIDWPLLKRCNRSSVEEYLRQEGISFEDRTGLPGLRILQSGARIGFENELLCSLYYGIENG